LYWQHQQTKAVPSGSEKAQQFVRIKGEADSPIEPAATHSVWLGPGGQQVVLYDEDPTNLKGNRYLGSAVWKFETETVGGLAQRVIRGRIEVPERQIGVAFSLWRKGNVEADHTIVLGFKLPADFPFGGIMQVPGILAKETEQNNGEPLMGLAEKISAEEFHIRLAATNIEKNMQLLKKSAWFDVPIIYRNGRRAILAIEKGKTGEEAFAEAFAAWPD
jgi:hypothetical protein